MRFGIMYDFRNPQRWHIPAPKFYRAMLDQIVEAEALGFEHVWLTEHHFTEDAYNPASLSMATAIAAVPSLFATLKGIVPMLPKAGYELLDPYVILQGLIATTFSIPAAFFLAYLVRERGWKLEQAEQVQGDASSGILVLAATSLAVMMASAALFYGKPTPPSLGRLIFFVFAKSVNPPHCAIASMSVIPAT